MYVPTKFSSRRYPELVSLIENTDKSVKKKDTVTTRELPERTPLPPPPDEPPPLQAKGIMVFDLKTAPPAGWFTDYEVEPQVQDPLLPTKASTCLTYLHEIAGSNSKG